LKLILDTFSGVFHADLILLKPTKFRVVCSWKWLGLWTILWPIFWL
jgi:hypothetical protein